MKTIRIVVEVQVPDDTEVATVREEVQSNLESCEWSVVAIEAEEVVP